MSELKIKVGLELDDDLKEQIDQYIYETAVQMGLDFKLEKMTLGEDDTLIMRIPTDEDGCVMLDYEDVKNYFDAIKNNVNCKNVFAIPDVLTFKVIDDECLELLVKGLNEELDKRKQNDKLSIQSAGDTYTWTKLDVNGKSSEVICSPKSIRFKIKEKTLCEILEELENDMVHMQRRIDEIVAK